VRVLAPWLFVAVAACSASVEVPDDGGVDAGVRDAGSALDAASPDGGFDAAMPPDAAAPDAGVADAAVAQDAGPSCPAPAFAPVGFSQSPDEVGQATEILDVRAESLVYAWGPLRATFQAPGLDLVAAGIGPGAASATRRFPFDILELADGRQLFAMRVNGLTADRWTSAPIALPGIRLAVSLVETCRGPDPEPLCGQPPAEAVQYGVDVGDDVVEAGERHRSELLTLSLIGAQSLPGYRSGSCTAESQFSLAAAGIAGRVEDP
jgi:hypothetical protein